MKIKMTLSEATEKLNLLNSFLSTEMPGNIAYRFGRFADSLESAVKGVRAVNDRYIKSNGKLNENGQSSIPSEDKEAIAKYNEYMDGVLAEEVEIELPKPTSVPEFESAKIKVSAKVMGYFLKIGIITEETEEKLD